MKRLQPIHSFLLLCWLLLVGLSLYPITSQAQEPFKDIKTALNSGKKFLEQGQPQEALNIFTRGYTQFNEPEFIFFSGDALLKLQKYQEAKEAFETYQKLAPTSKYNEEIAGLIKELTRILSTKIKLDSTPNGAAFWFDYQEGPPRGLTPAEVTLSPGSHTIILQKSGYGLTKTTVEIQEGKILSLTIPLEDPPVRLTVSTDPEKAEIFLDGSSLGFTPYQGEVSPGKHSLVLKKSGYGSVSITLNELSGKELVINQKMPPPNATLLFSDIPPKATITIDKKTSTLTERLEVAPGGHTIIIEADGFRPLTKRIQVSSGKELLINAQLQPKGVSLLVQSNIPGATFLINGKASAKTPMDAPLFIPFEERPTIQLSKEGFKPYKKKLPKKDGDYLLTVDLRKPGLPLGPTALLTTSLALGATGGVFGILAIQNDKKFEDTPSPQLLAKIDQQSNLSNLGFGAGTVLFVSGALWLRKVGGFRESPGKFKQQVAVLPTKNGAFATGSF
jgi:hypothetical protein